MEQFIERIIEEKKELDVKVEKLQEFLSSDKTDLIDPAQLKWMKVQCNCMESYSICLSSRLALLGISECK